jgi:uncharacterized membrane protein HdeD (DUF308 family)
MASSSPGLGFSAAAIRKMGSGWFAFIAVLFIVLGIFAIGEPLVASLAVTLLVGWLFVIAGIIHVVAAFRAEGTGRTIWQALVGVVYLGGGVYFLGHPLMALGTLTLCLAWILVIESVLEFVSYWRQRDIEGSSWLLMNSVITLVLAGLIWTNWPSSAVWAVGTLIGVKLLSTGISRLMLRFAARRLAM